MLQVLNHLNSQWIWQGSELHRSFFWWKIILRQLPRKIMLAERGPLDKLGYQLRFMFPSGRGYRDHVMLQRDFAKNALLQILFTILHEAAPLDDVISLSSSKVPYDTRSTFCYLGWLLWSARDERIFEREEL